MMVMNTLLGSIFVGAVISGLTLWLGQGINEVYRPHPSPVIAASTSEYATTPQDANEQCARTPGCVGFGTFFPTHQEAVIDQWLALYAHVENFLREYEAVPCSTDQKRCIIMIQEKLFAVSGYGAAQGREGFREARERRKQTAQPYASPLSSQTIRTLHAPFDRLGQTATRIVSPSFVPYPSYTQDIVYLLRGLQYQIKRTLLELDQTGRLVPWSVREE